MSDNSIEPPNKRIRTNNLEFILDSDSSSEEGGPEIKHQRLYLDTINRKVLDFDAPKICGVSLSDSNIYGCLQCNQYFTGRSKNSPSFAHSVKVGHHVFMNFDTLKFYILPENYEVPSEDMTELHDIQLLANPTFSNIQIKSLDHTPLYAYDLDHKRYHVGFVGMVNFGANGYANCVFQSLAHMSGFRDFLMKRPARFHNMDLIKYLSLLIRKLWSPYLFKDQVSCAEIMHYISIKSEQKFSIGQRSDPKLFLLWLLNHLQSELYEIKHNPVKLFQGKISLKSGKDTKFFVIPLSLPTFTVFRNSSNVTIPQVSLNSLLKSSNYQFKKLPKFLIISLKRFENATKLNGIHNSDLNPTIVKFDPDKLIIKEYTYRMVANICINSEINDIRYYVQVRDKTTGKWIEIRDLKLREIDKDLLFLSCGCLEFWERIN